MTTTQGMQEPGAGNDDPYADEERIPPPRKYPPPGMTTTNIGGTAVMPAGNGEGKWEKGVDMDMDIDVSRGRSAVSNEIVDVSPLHLLFFLYVHRCLSLP